MSDWDEIQRLAADLQRAQLSSASQKLSERNCIEIVNKLVETGLLDIIYTSDGKEYITPKHLQREISDEVYMSGGRIGIPELSAILTIDFSQIEAQANHLVKSNQPEPRARHDESRGVNGAFSSFKIILCSLYCKTLD